jgi:hypothetical protein
VSNAIWIVGVLLVIAHAVWTWRASNALAAAIAEIEARGEAMSVAALQPVIPPEDQNGYVELKQVMAIVATKTDAAKAFDDLEEAVGLPLREDERAILEPFLSERASARPLIDRAAAKSVCVMDVKLTSPLFAQDVPEWKELRSVANWLRAEAMHQLTEGDHATAIQRLKQIELIATAAATHPSLMGYLVANGGRTMQAYAIVEVSTELRIGTDRGAVSTSDTKRLISSLLDGRRIDSEQLLAYQGDRFASSDAMRNWWANDPSRNSKSPPADPPQKPSAIKRYGVSAILNTTALAQIEGITDLIPVLAITDSPTAREALSAWKTKHASEDAGLPRMIAATFLSSLDRPVEAKYPLVTDRHLAATALAVRWYRVENGGAWPGSLEALVPKYLPEVPRDPMAAGGKIQYRGGDNPILWSVGTNGTDEGGDDTPTRPRDGEWQRPDRVVYLTIQPRETETD